MSISNSDKKIYISEEYEYLPKGVDIIWQREDICHFPLLNKST